MEQFDYHFASARAAAGRAEIGLPPGVLCGVVGSGNLEVLMEPAAGDAQDCHITVQTAARGFGTIWQAVLESFSTQHAVGGTRVRIHDMGATPAVVTLRLRQALTQYTQQYTQQTTGGR